MKKLVNVVLSALMAISMMTILPTSASTTNLALNKTATASSFEVDSTNASKAVDGNENTWWGTAQNVASGEWINVNLGETKTVRQINLLFERDDAGQNVLGYTVSLNVNGTYVDVYTKSTKAAHEEIIVLDQDYQATDVKVTIDNANGGSINWVNVGIREIEVYDSEQAQEVSLESIAASIQPYTITTEDTTLKLPEVPNGYSIKINGADLEQIIADDGSIYHPFVNKTVYVSYEIKNDTTNETHVTNDIAYEVEAIDALAKYQLEVNGELQPKPQVIPEIQEWVSTGEGISDLSNMNKFYAYDDNVDAIVEEFAKDYELYTRTMFDLQASADNANFIVKQDDQLAQLGSEGYLLKIFDDFIEIDYYGAAGLNYGLQTVLQMDELYNGFLPQGIIRDYPKYEVRGILLDIARKPISLEMCEEVAKTMRFYKMNDLQIHLSDNYIFLENYGKGENENKAFEAYEAFRLESSLTNADGLSPTATDYSISKEDFNNFITSQRSLGMNIVPEIDLPAHATSFTKVWPELMVTNMVSPLNGNRPLVDHFNIADDAAVNKIKEIFDDYTKGENPTFDANTIVHVGADEFVASSTAYREFVNEIVPYVKETNTVRMWGGLTWLNDNKTEIIPEAIENVQMNLWSSDWADGKQMYDMGFELINTIDTYNYMVPNGSFSKGAYADLLNLNSVFNNFEANVVKTRSGWHTLPTGDNQILGAVYALWNDNIDKHSVGLTESDLYWRLLDAMPLYAEKTWAQDSKAKGSVDAIYEINTIVAQHADNGGLYQIETSNKEYMHFDFDDLSDSATGYDIEETVGSEINDGKLVLNNPVSYAETGLDLIGNDTELVFNIKLTQQPQAGDILFENDFPYGTHDIRILSDGTLGFTRELHEYSFGYTLPVNEEVKVSIRVTQQTTELYVNGEYVANATGKFIHNGVEKKTGITNATFALPLLRIGSKTQAIQAEINDVVVQKYGAATMDETKLINTKENKDIVSILDYSSQCGGEGEPSEGDGLGTAQATLDYSNSTYWHSNWSDNVGDVHWLAYDLGDTYSLCDITFLPRQGGTNGDIFEVKVYVSDDETFEESDYVNNYSFPYSGYLLSTRNKYQRVNFEEEVVGRYVKVEVVHSGGDSGNDKFASMSEIRFYGEKPGSEPVVPSVDKTALVKAIEDAKALKADDYTEATFTAVTTALAAAESVNADENATQEAVDAATKALTDAINALEEKPATPQPEPKPTMDFYDVQDEKAWFYGSVEKAFQKGLMGATGKAPVDGKPWFEPDTNISRAMVATVLYRMAGLPKVEFKATFKDVTDASLWYSTAITWAAQNNVVSGYKDGRFGCDDNITRQDLAIMLRNYAKSAGLDTNVTVDFAAFKDGKQVVDYATSAVAWCVEAKLMSGSVKADGTYLMPTANATRAECAKMFSLLDDAIKANVK